MLILSYVYLCRFRLNEREVTIYILRVKLDSFKIKKIVNEFIFPDKSNLVSVR